MTPEVLIGVPCYAGARNGDDDLLGWCLRSIREHTHTTLAYDLAVVDDSGTAEHQAKSRAVAERWGARWMAHERNRGIAAGWNTLTRSSDAPFVVLWNDDIVAGPASAQWLDAMIYCLRENRSVGCVSLHCVEASRAEVPALVEHGSPDPAHLPALRLASRSVDHFPACPDGNEPPAPAGPLGCDFAFRREWYERVGGFDDRFLSFYEETDFSVALLRAGAARLHLAWPTLYHTGGATFGRSRELDGRLDVSRRQFIEKWGADHFDVIPPAQAKIAPQTVRWLARSGPAEKVI